MHTLRTERLTLRPFSLADAPAVQKLVGEYEIALNTLMIPHPYPEGGAEEWIGRHKEQYEKDLVHHFALDDGQLVGAMSLEKKEPGIAELGYWVGKPFWRRGYATEAGRAVLRYGFEQCGLHRIFACHFTRNPASGRVLQKIGMMREGAMRQHVVKWGEPLDVVCYGALRDEWMEMH